MSTDGTDPARDDRPDELDAELRALFHDDRLEVRPRPHAPHHIVTGVRRRRRRRAVLAGAGTTLAVVAAAGSVLVLRGAGMPDGRTEAQFAAPPATSEEKSTAGSTALPPPDEPTAGTPRSSRDSAGPPSPAASGGLTGTGLAPEQGGPVRRPLPRIRDDGYRALELGMPYRHAVATDMLRVTGATAPPEGCASYPLVEGRDAVGLVTISAAHGVVSFEVTGAHTDDDVGVGARERRMRAAYPDGRYVTTPHENEWGSREPTPEREYVVDHPAGAFHIAVRDETVVGMRLDAHRSDC